MRTFSILDYNKICKISFKIGLIRGNEKFAHVYLTQTDARNRLTESANNGIITAYGYDNNGNLLDETTGGKVKSYAYDSFNRLTEVDNPDGTWMYNEYDAAGLRVAVAENGYRRDFTFDRGNVVTEVDAQGRLISRNIRGLEPISQRDGKGTLSYYLSNAHGDVTNLISETGEVLNSYTYDAFGNTLSSMEKVSNRFMYSGEQFDKITGQYYLRARYYNLAVGRFTQEDSYRGDGLNLYAYVANNPVKYTDPTGQSKDGGSKTTGSSYPYGGYQGTGNDESWHENVWDWTKNAAGTVASYGSDFARGVGMAGSNAVTYGYTDQYDSQIYRNNEVAYQLGKVVGDLGIMVVGGETTIAAGGAAIATSPTIVGAAAFGAAAVYTGTVTVSAAKNAITDSVKLADAIKGGSNPQYKKPISGSGKEKATDVPSWAKGNKPYVGESGNDFAKRLLDEKYGSGNYKTGPGTEFNQIKKWGDRAFK